MRKMAFYCGLLLVTMTLVVSSCTKSEYNLDNLNKEITVGASGLAVPLGSTAKLTFHDLLDEQTAKHVHIDYIAEGPLYASLFLEEGHGSFDMNDRVPDIAGLPNDVIKFDPFKYELKNLFDLSQIVIPPTIGEEEFQLPAALASTVENTDIEFDINIDLPSSVKSLSEVTVGSKARMRISVELQDPFVTKGNINPDLILDVSSLFQISGSNGKIDLGDLELSHTNNFTASKEYPIASLNLSAEDLQNIKKAATIAGSIILAEGAATTRAVFEGAKKTKLTVTVSFEDMEIKKIEGKIDYSYKPVEFKVDLKDVYPEGFNKEGMNIDFDNPYLVFSIGSNLGIPLVGNVSFVPFKGGKEMTDLALNFDIDFPVSSSYNSSYSRTFYVGKDDTYVKDHSSCHFIKGDISSIIKAQPDYILVKIDGGTDSTKDGIIEMGVYYHMSANYHIYMPLAFGEDFRMEMSDVIDVAGADLGDILNHAELVIGGKVHNQFPLNFDLVVELQDMNGSTLPTDPITQSIPACTGDSAPLTELNIKLNPQPGTDLSSLAKLNVKFIITSRGAEGIVITEKSYIHASLNLRMPSGITFEMD